MARRVNCCPANSSWSPGPMDRGWDSRRCPIPPLGKTAHLDFTTKDLDAEVLRLVAAGASEVGRHQVGESFRWVVLADPEGNAFCVAGQ